MRFFFSIYKFLKKKSFSKKGEFFVNKIKKKNQIEFSKKS